MKFDFEANEKQRELIESNSGIYLVDAGAGTGKTSTITRRYINILQKDNISPEDILLITFTKNAAQQMKDKIIKNSDYDTSELDAAPISTFHSHCKSIIDDYGFRAPEVLGIEDRITTTTRIIERNVLERQEFLNFFKQFMDDYRKYDDFFRIIRDEANILGLIKNLAAKGIFPEKGGWFKNSEKYLDGNYEEFEKIFTQMNAPNKGDYGPKQSDLRYRLYRYRWKCFVPGSPSSKKVLGDRGSKRVRKDFAKKAFCEDRELLKQFLHDVYYEYIKYALRKNYLNFSFLLMFAYAFLYDNHELREELSFPYVMVDEFQDTSEIQFKLAMLLAADNNICVVGDWKQSIYSFQYASVENIRDFSKRLNRYKAELNEDFTRIKYSTEEVKKISLVKNYRSTQKILDFAEQSLTLEATDKENLNDGKILEGITSLQAAKETENSEIGAYTCENEKQAVLSKIQEIVDNEEYVIEDGDGLRKLRYEDIAILSRTRRFGLELQEEARRYGIPVAYEGGIELFKTNPAILLLAWLRVVDYKHSKRGWSVILEEAGYKLDEVKKILEDKDYPEDMLSFRKELVGCRKITNMSRRVFDKYGMEDAFSDKIIDVLQGVYRSSYMNLGDIISFIEDNIDSREIYEVDNSLEEDMVKIQTLHSAKGLEYPVVFISDVNTRVFPSSNRNNSRIDYADPIGLRQKKIYEGDTGTPYVYDNWRTEILFNCVTGSYDEERRLMYVGMTRAENYLFITSTEENASNFFTGLNIEKQKLSSELEARQLKSRKRDVFEIEEFQERAPVKFGHDSLLGLDSQRYDEISEKVFEYNRFVKDYLENGFVGEDDSLKKEIRKIIDNFSGEIIYNKYYIYPFKTEKRKVVVEGYMDLICIDNEKVSIYSFLEPFLEEDQMERLLTVQYYTLKRAVDVNVETYGISESGTRKYEPSNRKNITRPGKK